nr:hypothetical protein Iba_chr08dCG0870 [Ipomoea batatas]
MLINTPAICPDLSLVSSQGAYISHPNHGLSKAVKELALAVPKPVNYGHRVGAGGGKQFLVGLEKSLVVLQVGEVVAVEAVWRDKATRSVESSCLSLNLRETTSRLSKGLGISLVPSRFAALLSLRPIGTSHDGPPACVINRKHHYYLLPILP